MDPQMKWILKVVFTMSSVLSLYRQGRRRKWI